MTCQRQRCARCRSPAGRRRDATQCRARVSREARLRRRRCCTATRDRKLTLSVVFVSNTLLKKFSTIQNLII